MGPGTFMPGIASGGFCDQNRPFTFSQNYTENTGYKSKKHKEVNYIALLIAYSDFLRIRVKGFLRYSCFF